MSKETPQITTILTTYRRPMYLRRAIMSVLKQTYRNVRVLVLDDASNDETEQVVHALATEDSRVQYVRHERNIGMTPNWRFGLEHVETPYFSFLSDDDLHLPGFYLSAFKELEGNRAVDFYCGATIMFDTQGNISGVSTHGWTEGVYHPYDGMLKMMQEPPNWDGVLFRKAVFEKIGTLSNIHATDYEFLVRAARRCSFVVTHEPCAMFQYHAGRQAWKPAINSKSQELFHESVQLASDLLGAKELPPEVRAAAWPVMNAQVLSAGKYLFLTRVITRQAQEALEVAHYLRRLSPGSFKAYKFVVLAVVLRRFPAVSSWIHSRLLKPKPLRGRQQRQWQACYGRWTFYASQLLPRGDSADSSAGGRPRSASRP